MSLNAEFLSFDIILLAATVFHYQVDHVLAQFILQSTKRLPDHRLLASALAARLLIHSEAGATDDGGLDTLAVRDNMRLI